MKRQRYDRSLIHDFCETPEGYLTVNAPITRPGVFPYRRHDGSIEMEAKLPEELFSQETIQSANAKPITDDHPHEAVTIQNYSKYAKGLTHNDASVKDNKLCISFTITDADTITKVKNGKRELSIGFLADIEPEKGIYNGVQYDSIQKNMKINHLAIVEKGRAGPTVAIRGDSVAFMIDNNDIDGGKQMKLVLDGIEYEVDTVVKSKYEETKAKLDASEMKVKEHDILQGKYDALETKLKEKEKEIEEMKKNTLTGDSLDKVVEERISLINKSQSILGDSFDFTGKSDREIKEAVITSKKSDFKGDGKSDDYINAFYDAMVETSSNQGFTQSVLFGDGANDKTKIENKRNARLNLKNNKSEV